MLFPIIRCQWSRGQISLDVLPFVGVCENATILANFTHISLSLIVAMLYMRGSDCVLQVCTLPTSVCPIPQPLATTILPSIYRLDFFLFIFEILSDAMQYFFFFYPVWLISLSVILSRLIHVVANAMTFFFLKTK